MGQYVMLDAAFPPSPSQWVTDIVSVGGRAGAIYTYGGFTNYTPQHVQQARSAGVFVLPIVVPGDNPPDAATVLASVLAYGITKGPVAKDREAGSLWTPQWGQAFDTAAHVALLRPIDYHNLNDAVAPPDLDDQWLAEWLRTGVMDPIPALPQGYVAWQFVNGVVINGTTYDVSVVSDQLWSRSSGGNAMAGSLVMAPFDSNRLDFVWADAAGVARVKTSTGGAGGLDSSTQADVIPAAGAPTAGFFDVQAMWDNLNRLCYVGFGNDGNVYLAVQRLDGSWAQGWSQLQGVNVPVPTRATTAPAIVIDADLRKYLAGVPQ